MIPIKRILSYDIAPVVTNMTENVSILQHELVDSHVIDLPIVEGILEQIQSSLSEIQEWAKDLHRLKLANQP